MKKAVLCLPLICPVVSGAQTFNEFTTRVNVAPDLAKTAIIDSFMSAVPSFPYIEGDTLVHFIFRGGASRVTVPGDANGWQSSARLGYIRCRFGDLFLHDQGE